MFNSITDTKRMKCTVDELVKAGRLNVVAGTEESLYDRIKNIGIIISEYREISEYVTAVRKKSNSLHQVRKLSKWHTESCGHILGNPE